jgi:uncharacterized membrane protein (DUF4010 family)
MLVTFVISASLGALIGLQRQWAEQQTNPDVPLLAGLRTFTLWAMWGTFSALAAERGYPLFYPVAFAGLLLLLLAIYRCNPEKPGGLGPTTITVAVLTFGIGSLVYWEQRTLAVFLTVSLLLVLASRQAVHNWTKKLTRDDIRSALQFAAITGVVLPLVPRADFGPFGAFNPFSTWLMVVLVAGLGFLGYAAMRVLGTQAGIGVTGLIGGLASSTATTLAFSRQSRDMVELSRSFALAIILACTVMLARVAFMVLAVNPSVFSELWPALAVMSLPGIGIGIWWWKSQRTPSTVSEPALRNPLSLGMAIKFALLYAAVVFFAKAASHYYGGAGVYWVSFFSGLTDMDAIALSLSQMAGSGQIDATQAARGILIGALSNTGVKAGLAIAFGSVALRGNILLAMGLTLVAGFAAWWMI